MFGFILCFILLFFGCVCLLMYRANKKKGKYEKSAHDDFTFGSAAVICFALSAFLFLGSILFTLIEYSRQINDFENLVMLDEKEIIYEDKSMDLISEFKFYLVDTYPEHEQGIFDKISPDSVRVYLAKYPEIRAIEGVKDLVERIDKLRSEVYAKRIEKAEIKKNIRYRQRDPWILNFIIP
jgi:hypothetical protein